MLNKTIYDREEFCEKIINAIENSEETSAFILYSQVGVGKSTVYKKIENILNNGNNKYIIRVPTQANKNIQEGSYLKNIFKYIHRYFYNGYKANDLKQKSKYKKYTFSFFLAKKQPISAFFQCMLNNSDKMISSNQKILVLYIVKLFIEYLFSRISSRYNINIDSIQDYTLITEYLKYVLNSGNIILNIENIQNMDSLSLDYFLECLMDTKYKNNFMLLEFNLPPSVSNYQAVFDLKNEFDNASIDISVLKLENLDINNVIKVAHDHCSNKDYLFDIAVENNYKKLYNGNLIKVEHFANIYSENVSDETDPTFEKIKNLPKQKLYILAIIIINNAMLDIKILKALIQNANNDYLIDFKVDVIDFCNEGEFIEQIGNDVKIVHSNIIDVWYQNINVFKKYELTAYKTCESMYSNILRNNLFHTMPKQQCILLLFQLYGKFEITKMSDMLPHIDDVIYGFLSIDELSNYLRQLIDSIQESGDAMDYLYRIIDICIKFQLFKMEGYCLQKIENIKGDIFNEKYSLYQYIKLFQGEEYERLLALIKKDRKNDLSMEFEAYCTLFEIVSYRALNQKEKYTQLVKFTDNNNHLKQMIHYAYFLRLAEAYEKRDLAIPKVENSIVLFKDANLPVQVAKSRVSLAFLYAITGKIGDAKHELELSEKILLKNIENKYVFNINKACLNLLSDDFSEKTWILLDEAEKCTQIKFDQIAIIIDKIIWCIENSNYVKGHYLENKGLELLDTESDRHIHAIFYYNCYVLNKAMKKINEQKKYYQLAYENRQYCETLKARLENQKQVSDNTTFLLSKPWHVCFVSYWYFDYLKDLK